MMRRVPRYPPLHARLIRLEEGPPMYRMLGYVGKNNVMSDLCDVIPPGFLGPFAMHRLPSNQMLPFGPSQHGLPTHPLPYSTVYFDDSCPECDTLRIPYHKMVKATLPERRLEEVLFPELAVPGSGMQSRVTDSGFLYREGLPPPRAYSDSNQSWKVLNMHSGQFNA